MASGVSEPGGRRRPGIAGSPLVSSLEGEAERERDAIDTADIPQDSSNSDNTARTSPANESARPSNSLSRACPTSSSRTCTLSSQNPISRRKDHHTPWPAAARDLRCEPPRRRDQHVRLSSIALGIRRLRHRCPNTNLTAHGPLLQVRAMTRESTP